jgi:hypothetical protein
VPGAPEPDPTSNDGFWPLAGETNKIIIGRNRTPYIRQIREIVFFFTDKTFELDTHTPHDTAEFPARQAMECAASRTVAALR